MEYKYNGVVCSDLDITKKFIEDILLLVKDIVRNKDDIFDIKLILNELIINSVLHGNNNTMSKQVKLSLEIDENKIKIQVEDEGPGINYDIKSYDSSVLECNGRGLVLVSGLSDEFYINKNIVTAIKKIC